MSVQFVRISTIMERKSDCEHHSILFFEEDCTFRCMKCNEKLAKLKGIDEFKVFCGLSEIDPKSLTA